MSLVKASCIGSSELCSAASTHIKCTHKHAEFIRGRSVLCLLCCSYCHIQAAYKPSHSLFLSLKDKIQKSNQTILRCWSEKVWEIVRWHWWLMYWLTLEGFSVCVCACVCRESRCEKDKTSKASWTLPLLYVAHSWFCGQQWRLLVFCLFLLNLPSYYL